MRLTKPLRSIITGAPLSSVIWTSAGALSRQGPDILKTLTIQEAVTLLAQAGPAALRLRGTLEKMRVFRIVPEEAPGLCLIGGLVSLTAHQAEAYGAPNLSVTGSGYSEPDALTSCLGEAAEYLAQFQEPDVQVAAPAKGEGNLGWIGAALAMVAGEVDWVSAMSHATGTIRPVPADFVFRRPAARRCVEPVGALSAGCAAGLTFEAALEHATLELIERDAAALWWYGGRKARSIAANLIEAAPAHRLRLACTTRQTHFLDITTDLGVPVCAAWSALPDGTGLACGLAARHTMSEAMAAALREMAQMELAAPIARMKATERGESSLNDADRRHLDRSSRKVADIPALMPSDEGVRDDTPAYDNLDALARCLGDKGCDLLSINLTLADQATFVARAICPDLQPYTMQPATQRLRDALATSSRTLAPEKLVPLF